MLCAHFARATISTHPAPRELAAGVVGCIELAQCFTLSRNGHQEQAKINELRAWWRKAHILTVQDDRVLHMMYS